METHGFITHLRAHIFSGYPVYLLLLITVGIGFFNDSLWIIPLIVAIHLMFSNKTESKRINYLKHTNGKIK